MFSPCKWSNMGTSCSRCRSPSRNATRYGAVEGAMCPSPGGTREDVFWGHHHLLSCRLYVHETSPTELGLAELRPHFRLNFLKIFFQSHNPEAFCCCFRTIYSLGFYYLLICLLSHACFRNSIVANLQLRAAWVRDGHPGVYLSFRFNSF